MGGTSTSEEKNPLKWIWVFSLNTRICFCVFSFHSTEPQRFIFEFQVSLETKKKQNKCTVWRILRIVCRIFSVSISSLRHQSRIILFSQLKASLLGVEWRVTNTLWHIACAVSHHQMQQHWATFESLETSESCRQWWWIYWVQNVMSYRRMQDDLALSIQPSSDSHNSEKFISSWITE